MTNLDKMNAQERLTLSRNYFIIGWFLLPFVWLANTIWFWPDCYGSRVSENLETTKTFRKYFIGSMVGCVVWFGIIISWIVYFQAQRHNWGPTSDMLYYWIPYGE